MDIHGASEGPSRQLRDAAVSWTEHRHADAAELAGHAAAMLEAQLRNVLARRDRATLALAGGSTPWPVYRVLARTDLDWSRVTLLPTDERCVPRAHDASNAAAIERAFETARGVRVARLVPDDGNATRAETYAQQALASLGGTPFAAVVLGMGGDAHTASLFPHSAQLQRGLDMRSTVDALRVDPDPMPPDAPFPRISLTLPRLLCADAVHLLVTGDAKRHVLHRAMQTPADVESMPIAAVLHAPGVDVHIHWSP